MGNFHYCSIARLYLVDVADELCRTLNITHEISNHKYGSRVLPMKTNELEEVEDPAGLAGFRAGQAGGEVSHVGLQEMEEWDFGCTPVRSPLDLQENRVED